MVHRYYGTLCRQTQRVKALLVEWEEIPLELSGDKKAQVHGYVILLKIIMTPKLYLYLHACAYDYTSEGEMQHQQQCLNMANVHGY